MSDELPGKDEHAAPSSPQSPPKWWAFIEDETEIPFTLNDIEGPAEQADPRHRRTVLVYLMLAAVFLTALLVAGVLTAGRQWFTALLVGTPLLLAGLVAWVLVMRWGNKG